MTAANNKVQSSAASSGVALVGAVVTMVANFAIAYLVFKDGAGFAGVFASSTALVTVAGTATALGTNTGLVYFMPKALEDGGTNTRSLIMNALRVVVPLSAAVALALFVLAPTLGDIITKTDENAELFSRMLRIMSPGVLAWAITYSLLGATRGLGSMTPTVGINQIFRPGVQGLGIAALLLGTNTPNGTSVAIAWVAPILIAGAAAVAITNRMGGFASSEDANPVESSEFWAFTRPRALSSSLQIALERIDVLIISAILGVEASGIYSTVSRFATAGNFLIFSVAQAVSANLRKAVASEKWAQARSQLRHATSWMVIIAWPYFLVVAFKSEAMAGLFRKPELLEGTSALTILGLGMMASAAAGPADLALLMLGKSKASLWGAALAFATDIVLLLLLLEPFGIVGAALAWAAAVMVQNGVASYMSYKVGGLVGPGKPSLVAAVGAVLAVVPIAIVTPQTFTGLLIVAAVAIPLLLGWIFMNREVMGLAALRRSS